MKKMYLANPLGFTECGRDFLDKIINTLSPFLDIYEPFRDLPQKLKDEHETIIHGNFSKNIFQGMLKTWNMKVGEANAKAIANSNYLLAILDGQEIDSGTSSEIGFGFSCCQRVFGYRNDFRNSGDNSAAIVNLQVEYFIRKSGGTIFSTLSEMEYYFSRELC